MYRRRLLPLSTTSTSTTSFLKSDPKNYLNNFTNPPNKLTEFPGFLSQTSTDLLLASYRRHLVAVSELAFGTQATINQAQMELFRIVEVAERGEGRIRNPRLWHHASQAWNLEFFLRGLVMCKLFIKCKFTHTNVFICIHISTYLHTYMNVHEYYSSSSDLQGNGAI